MEEGSRPIVGVPHPACATTNRVKIHPLADRLISLTTGAESALYTDTTYDSNDALTDEWTDRVVGTAFIDDKPEFHYFSPKMVALQKGLEAAFPNVSVRAVSWEERACVN